MNVPQPEPSTPSEPKEVEPAPNDDDDAFLAAARAVDDALAAIASWPEEHAEAAVAIKDAVEAFHEPVLRKFVQAMRADDNAKHVLFELVDDPHVLAVLALHGIVRSGTASAADEGEPPDPNDASAEISTTIIPIESITTRSRLRSGWTPGPLADDIEEAETFRFDLASDDGERLWVLFTRLDGEISAFRNACPHQGLTLDGPPIIDGTLVCPWHGWEFDAKTGVNVSDPAECLERFYCRVDSGRIWFKVPT